MTEPKPASFLYLNCPYEANGLGPAYMSQQQIHGLGQYRFDCYLNMQLVFVLLAVAVIMHFIYQ